MALFNFGKKKEEKNTCCNCACSSNTQDNITTDSCINIKNDILSIKVLGAGCKSCHEQYENTKKAVNNIGLNTEVEYITDLEKVMTYGVMSMPAIVVNEKVVSTGKVLKTNDVENLLHKLGF